MNRVNFKQLRAELAQSMEDLNDLEKRDTHMTTLVSIRADLMVSNAKKIKTLRQTVDLLSSNLLQNGVVNCGECALIAASNGMAAGWLFY